MRSATLAICLALTAVADAKPAADLTSTMLAAVHDAAGCGTPHPSYGGWCKVADGWAKGTAAALPNTALVGATLALDKSAPVDLMTAPVLLSGLGIRKGAANLAHYRFDDTHLMAKTAAAIGAITAFLLGKSDKVAIAKPLADLVAALPAAATIKLKRGKHGWTWQGAVPAELRKVGPLWVVVELPPNGSGIALTVLTERFAAE